MLLLQLAASLCAVSFYSRVSEGQRALVHSVHVQTSFPLPDVTAHSDEHHSHGAPCLWRFSVLLLHLRDVMFLVFRRVCCVWGTSATS